MYSAHPSLRYLFVFGLFGLAVLTPPKDLYPTWLVMSVLMSPLVLLELGAGIEGEAERPGVLRFARLLQLLGAGLFVFDLGLFLALRDQRFERDVYFGTALSSTGLIAALLVMRAASSPASGEGTVTRRSRWFSSAASVVAAICLLFTLVLIALAVKGPANADAPPLLASSLLFGGCFSLAVSQLVSRWRFERGTSRARWLHNSTQILGFLGMGLSCVLFGAAEDTPLVPRILTVPLGALFVGVGLWLLARRFFGVRAGLSYHVVREGLLEKTRRYVLLYPWPHVAAVSLGEYYGNSALFVFFEDAETSLEVLWHRSGEAEALAKKRRKSHRTNAALTGAQLLIMETAVDEDLGVLFGAIEGALNSAAVQQALAPAASLLAPR